MQGEDLCLFLSMQVLWRYGTGQEGKNKDRDLKDER